MYIHSKMERLSVRAVKYLHVFAVSGVMLMILNSCSIFPREEEVLAPPLVKPVKVEYDLYEVKRQTIKKTVTGTGTFIFSKRFRLSYKYSGGRLKAIYVKEGDKVKAGTVMAELENEGILDNIKRTEAELRKAKLRLELAELDRESMSVSGSPPIELKKADINIELLEIDIMQIEETLAKLKSDYQQSMLVSPIDGTVTYVTDYNEGDPIYAYSTIIEVADPSELVLDWQCTDYEGRSSLNVGMEVEVKANDAVLKGKIIAMPADFLLEENSDKYRDTIRIKVDDIPESVEAGNSASITAILVQRDNVIVVPKNAIRMDLGRNYVFILEGNAKRERNVELGIQTPSEVEIVKGLEEGQKVILR